VLRSEYKYTLRVSKRAKYARLQMSPREGLIVIVPKGYDQDRIPDLLAQKRSWIEKVTRQMKAQRDLGAGDVRPECIELRSVGEIWRVDYQAGASKRVLERSGKRLILPDGKGDLESNHAALQRWLRRKAERHLKPWARHLAEENGFKVRRIFIKSQRTRWGSCSEKKNINLNMKLLFLPEELVQYVLLHELCHTVYLNHSKKFWVLVGEHVPDYVRKRKALKSAWTYVPDWVEIKT
jgi:predicted metal-dependent hydrolase